MKIRKQWDSLNLRDNLTATSVGAKVGFNNSCPAVRRDIPEPENSGITFE